MANWTTIENALHAWVVSGSGLANDHVIWHEQSKGRPAGPFITLRLNSIVPVAQTDQVISLTDLTRSAGQEIELQATGMREFVLSLQAFGAPTVSPGTARALLSAVQTSLGLPSVRAAFDASGFSCFDTGRVQNITALLGTAFEGRALMECRFYTVESASEFTGYINTVSAQSYLGPPDSGTKDGIDI